MKSFNTKPQISTTLLPALSGLTLSPRLFLTTSDMQSVVEHLEASLRQAQQTIASLEKERAAKDLRLLENIAELRSLRNRVNRLILQVTETLQ